MKNRNLLIVGIVVAVVSVIVAYVVLGTIEAQRAIDDCKNFAPSVGLSPERCR